MTSSIARDLMDEGALTDDITGLPRVAVLREHLWLALRRAGQSGGLVGVVVVDIDRFGGIDRQWGWGAGDAALREVGQRIAAVLREPDMAARLGGDVFAAVCEGLEDADHVEMLALRVRRALRLPVAVPGHVISVSASIGTAVGPGTISPDALIAAAEQDLRVRRAAG